MNQRSVIFALFILGMIQLYVQVLQHHAASAAGRPNVLEQVAHGLRRERAGGHIDFLQIAATGLIVREQLSPIHCSPVAFLLVPRSPVAGCRAG